MTNSSGKQRTNFDRHLDRQLKNPDFAERFSKTGEAWDVALQLATLRKNLGLTQAELAKRVGTSQQQISRLESPDYEGHSLSMLRRVADVLGARVRVEICRWNSEKGRAMAEHGLNHRQKR